MNWAVDEFINTQKIRRVMMSKGEVKNPSTDGRVKNDGKSKSQQGQNQKQNQNQGSHKR